MADTKTSSNKKIEPKISVVGRDKVPEEKETIGAEVGYVGTDIFSGYITVDYQKAFADNTSLVRTVDEMMGSDATVEAVLEAIKAPILSSKFFMEPASDDEEEKEIAQFVQGCFDGLQGGFLAFLEESLTQYDYGYAIFEKVFKKKGDKVGWYRFAPRVHSSIEKWEIVGKKWRNGHPAGITQQINNTDDADNTPQFVSIPWKKLLIFHHKKRGNNFQGRSVLRGAYLHWKMKNILYKVSAVSADRFGVGIPFIKHKPTQNKATLNSYKELVKNIKSNEQSYAVFDNNVEEFGILTPGGGSEKGMIKDLIAHHDKKIYDSILAGFLNLTSGEGGSNALSKDQSSFFLRSLQGKVEQLCYTLQGAIEELVILNWGKREKYPTLKCSDVGQISIDEYVTALKGAKEGGLMQWLEADEAKLREQLKLPSLPPKDEEDMETDRIESELDTLEIEVEGIDVGDGEDLEETEKPDEEEEPEGEEEPTKEELTEFLGEELGGFAHQYVAKGGHLDQETKDKISKALRKRGGDTLKGEVERDPLSQKLFRRKETIKAAIQNLRTKLKDFKAKKSGMGRAEKRAFNKAMKSTIDVIRKQKAALIQGRININKQRKARKGELRTARKERKTKAKIDKAIAREEKKRAKSNDRIDKLQDKLKKAETSEAKKKIRDKIEKEKAKIDEDFGSRFQAEDSPKPTERERAFMKNIRDFENYLESEYNNYDIIVTKSEEALRPRLAKIYEQSDSELIDGVRVLAPTAKNRELQKKALAMVDLIQEDLDKKLIDSGIQDRLFRNSKRMAVGSVKENEKLLATIVVNEGQFNSFIAGYKSNVEGVLFNEGRRVKEAIVLNYGSQVSVGLAVKQAGAATINRNILKLSTVTHARGAYQGIQYDNAVKGGFTMYKTVVPLHKIKTLSPSGMTSSLLYLILTAAEINRRASKATDGKTTEAVSGLNLHHGGFMYYYPIASEDLEEEKELAKQQRERFINSSPEAE